MSDNTQDSGGKVLDGTMAKILSALLVAVVLAWAASITRTINTVTGLEPQIQQIQATQEKHDQWIADWPTTGELAADVRQTKDIEFLFKELEESNREIDAIKERLRNLELNQTTNNVEP